MTAKTKDQFFVVVDEYEDHPETGELMLKRPLMRPIFPCVNKRAYEKDGVYHPAVKRSMIAQSWHGVYTVLGNDEYNAEKMAVMTEVVKDHPKKIIGPYDSIEDAIQAKHAERTQTPREKVGSLSIENKELNTELAELKAQIARLEGGAKPPTAPKPPKPEDK